MKIIEKISAKEKDNRGASPVTVAFIGDSVTHGCFDCYFDERGIQTYFDAASAYATRFGEIMRLLYPSAQINVVNSGVSGDNARGGNARFERDVAKYSPDLVVVSFGLNDACSGEGYIETYLKNLGEIFDKTAALGAECIFLTENFMCSKVSCHLPDGRAKEFAAKLCEIQNSGRLKRFFDAGKELAKVRGVKICDVYSAWEKLNAGGVDTTDLLANKYNHPIEKLHYYTAIKLIETIFG